LNRSWSRQWCNGYITTPEDIQVVPIVPIQRIWEGKSGMCSHLQVPLFLAWAITVHKSQGLTIPKAMIDLGKNEFAAGLSFVAISRVRSLSDIIFNHFSFERLQRIQKCKQLCERILEEERLVSLERRLERNDLLESFTSTGFNIE